MHCVDCTFNERAFMLFSVAVNLVKSNKTISNVKIVIQIRIRGTVHDGNGFEDCWERILSS